MFTSNYCLSQFNLTDSANSTNWPNGITGDTIKFKRTPNAVITNSTNPLKHQFQLNFNYSQTKSAQFYAEISSEINLSSSNFIEFGFLDPKNNKIQIRIGNTLDQLQVLNNDTIIFKGQENEFNVSQFHYSFNAHLNFDTLFLHKIDIQKSIITIDTILLKVQFQKIYAYLKIQQYGTSAIGKIKYHFLYFGKNRIDNSTPEIIKIAQIDNQKIAISFKKPILTVVKSQCKIDNLFLDSITNFTNTQIVLTIKNSNRIKRDSIKIYLINIKDLYSNINKTFDLKIEYTYLDTPNFGDIILTEIMSNPSPSLGILPEKKYIEIYNNGPKYIDANTLYISDSKSTAKIPKSIIQPFEYYTCISESDSNFFQKSQAIKIKSFPSFNIESDFVSIKNARNEVLIQFEYNQNMHNPDKIDGGYSLEKTNVKSGVLETNNWQSNSSLGGTPGFENSNDSSIKIQPFRVVESYFKNDTLTIKFNHNTNPNKIGKVKFASLPDTIYLHFFQNIAMGYCKCPPFVSETILPIFLRDVLENEIKNPFMTYNTNTSNSNIKFNEILFHNFPYKPDFFELVNIDTTAVFLENINLKIFDENFQNFKSNLALKNNFRELIYPNEILAFSSNSKTIGYQFPSTMKENVIDLYGFPNFSAEGGSLQLVNVRNGNLIDKLTFNNNLHSPNISNPIGLSLEKNAPGSESNDVRNWQSAIESCGGATPGKMNSVNNLAIENSNSKHFNIPQKRIINQTLISPLQIDFQFSQSGYICNAIIFNKYGQLICESIKNQRLTQQGTLTIWPNSQNQKLPSENYIIKLEAFYPNGDLCREIHRFTVLNQ